MSLESFIRWCDERGIEFGFGYDTHQPAGGRNMNVYLKDVVHNYKMVIGPVKYDESWWEYFENDLLPRFDNNRMNCSG